MIPSAGNLVRCFLLVIFIGSATTAVSVRTTGYTNALIENGKHFATFRSAKYEVSEQEYYRIQRKDPLTRAAVVAMMLSLFAFIGIESIRFRRVRLRNSQRQVNKLRPTITRN